MALQRWERFGFDRPERFRRWFDLGLEPEGWLRVEEIREDGALVIRAELPGVDPDKDVEVSVSEGVLHISAKREDKREQRGKGGYRSEFRYGEFFRNLPLPSGVEPDAVAATYHDGILEVRVPWSEEEEVSSAKRIAISRS